MMTDIDRLHSNVQVCIVCKVSFLLLGINVLSLRLKVRALRILIFQINMFKCSVYSDENSD